TTVDIPSRRAARVERCPGRHIPAEAALEAVPGGVADDRDRAPAIVAGARIDAVGHGVVRGIALLAWRHAGTGLLQVHVADEERRRLGLGHLDVLALARAATVLERRQYRHRRELTGDVIRVVQRRAGGVGRVREVPQPVA